MSAGDGFTPLDLRTWPRGQMFYYFARMAPTGYSLTVDLDVTHMRAVLKNAGLKFFPACLWLTTRTLNAQVEFRVAEREGQPGGLSVFLSASRLEPGRKTW